MEIIEESCELLRLMLLRSLIQRMFNDRLHLQWIDIQQDLIALTRQHHLDLIAQDHQHHGVLGFFRKNPDRWIENLLEGSLNLKNPL